ncbi:MAG: sigma-70 family RNA polymerase sigma factor [Clostridia bacterium]|nr:sigma-70 family RNA polymerase sigma factor [Clostridia bacterium]
MADLEAIYRRHADTVYRFLLAKTGSRDLAEELTQETFFRAVGAINRFDGNCRVTTWLCGIARNVLYGYYRLRKSGDVSLDDIPEPAVSSAEETVIGKIEKERTLEAIRALPEPGREILTLRLSGGLSFRQIGEALGQTENWARVNFYRAKQKIIKEIGENER